MLFRSVSQSRYTWSSLDNFHWYGNWGGPGWASGGWNSESNVNMPRNPSNPNYKEPINKRDRCYYGHDTCLNDCTYICNPDARKNCRVECDKKLSNCLQNLPKSYTKTWGGSVCRWIEESLFGSGWVNNNPGTYNNRR